MGGTWESKNIPENPNWIPYNPGKPTVKYGGEGYREQLIRFISSRPEVTTKELNAYFGVKEMNSGARAALRKLVAEGVVCRVKFGLYRMANNGEG